MIRKISFHTYAINNFLIQTNNRSFKLSCHESLYIPQLSNYQILNVYILNYNHGYLTGRLRKNLMVKLLLTNKSVSCIFHNKLSNIIIKSIITRNEYDNNIDITLYPSYRKTMCLTF
jgi:hypothetical protein